MTLTDSFYTIMAEYTRLERNGPVRDGEPDAYNDLEYAARLDGMRRVIGLLNGIPATEAHEGGEVSAYIARWQDSHADYLSGAVDSYHRTPRNASAGWPCHYGE